MNMWNAFATVIPGSRLWRNTLRSTHKDAGLFKAERACGQQTISGTRLCYPSKKRHFLASLTTHFACRYRWDRSVAG